MHSPKCNIALESQRNPDTSYTRETIWNKYSFISGLKPYSPRRKSSLNRSILFSSPRNRRSVKSSERESYVGIRRVSDTGEGYEGARAAKSLGEVVLVGTFTPRLFPAFPCTVAAAGSAHNGSGSPDAPADATVR